MSLVWWIFLYFGARCFSAAVGAEVIRFDVPREVHAGDEAMLTCNFDLEGEPLYSVSWYKDYQEIYRYAPLDKPPYQFYPVKGVYLDHERSKSGTIYLKDIDNASEGTYVCSVLGGARAIEMIRGVGELKVKDTRLLQSGSMQLPCHSLIGTSLMLIVLWIM